MVFLVGEEYELAVRQTILDQQAVNALFFDRGMPMVKSKGWCCDL